MTLLPPPPSRPLPRHISPATAARLLGLTDRAVRYQLAAAPQDAEGRVTAGRWAGAYRKPAGEGTRWRIPARALQMPAGLAPVSVAGDGLTHAEVVALIRQEVAAALSQVAAALAQCAEGQQP